MKDPTDSKSIFNVIFFTRKDPCITSSLRVFANDPKEASDLLTKTGANVIEVNLIEGPFETDA